MPRYDVTCSNGHEREIVTRWDDWRYPCPECGHETRRIWKASAAVRGDECDFYDPNFERRFTSRAEHDRVLKEHGLVRKVRHVGGKGSDKSAHTQRWDVCPSALLISEEDRIAGLRAFDERHGLTMTPQPVTLIVPEPVSAFSPEQHAQLSAKAAQVGL